MRLAAEAFLNFGPQALDFDQLFGECLRRRCGIEVRLETGFAQISPFEIEPSKPLDIRGNSVAFRSDCKSIGARLLLPLMSSITHVGVPSGQVYAMRRHERSIADFFARNLFFAMSRSDDAICDISPAAIESEECELQKAFALRYLWVMRSQLAEPILKDPNLSDKLLINAQIKTFRFNSPLLESGADEIRHCVRSGRLVDGQRKRFERLLIARDRMSAHFN